MGRKKFRVPGVSFSWKRALGISQAKARISRRIGIPLSRSGRRRKFGRLFLRGCGCSTVLLFASGLAVLSAAVVVLKRRRGNQESLK